MKLLRKTIFILVFLLSYNSLIAQNESDLLKAKQELYLSNSDTEINISSLTYYYEDESLNLNLNDILLKNNSFILNKEAEQNFGYSKSTYWFKFSGKTDKLGSNNWFLEIDYPPLNEIILYYQSTNNKWDSLLLGTKYPANKRSYKSTNYIIPLTFSDNSTKTFYLKIRSESSLQIPLRILSSEKNLSTQIIRETYYAGVLGIFILIFFFSLFLFMNIKSKAHLYYMLSILGSGGFLFTMSGHVDLFLLNNFTALSNPIREITVGFWILGSSLFILNFLEIKNKLFLRIFKAIIIYSVIQIVSAFFIPYYYSVRVWGVVSAIFPALLLFVGIKEWQNGKKQARFYILAWLIYLIGTIMLFARLLGFLPVDYLVTHSMVIPTVLEAVFVIYALTDKQNLIVTKRKQTDIKLLKSKIKQQELLEIKISERTHKLVRSNTKIQKKNAEINDINKILSANKEALEKSEDRQRKILDTFRDGIYINTPEYKIAYTNSALQEKIGYNPVGESCYKALYNLQDKCRWCIYTELTEGKENTMYEFEEKDGKTLIVNNILLEGNNKLTVFRDISERKEAIRALAENEERFRLAQEAGNIGTWEWNIEKDEVIWSDTALRIFDKENNPNIVSSNDFFNLVHPDDRKKIVAELEIALKNRQTEHKVEYRIIKKNDEISWINEVSNITTDNTGKLVKMIGILQDITNNKKAEKALKQAKLEAEKSNSLKSEFLANMSHEIRTPMNAIIGFSSLLQRQMKNEKHLSFIDKIAKSGNNLLELINDILDLSKIEAGQLEIQKEEANPHDIFNEIPLIFSEIIEEKKLSLIVTIDEKLPKSLLIDAAHIRQILLNLTSNALKFTKKGSISIKITVSQTSKDLKTLEVSKLDLIIEIKDTGIGIPENQIGIIFQSFRQADGQSTRKYGGTGLGLTITKRLVEFMDGEISVKSTVGVGSVFRILLRNIEILDSENIEIEAEDFTVTFDKSEILHVEDVEYNRELVSFFLDNENVEIKEVETGKQALKILETFTPDLILMDIQMPGLNGYETTKIIRKSKNLKSIPVIALTANATKEEIEKYSHVFDEYITKPIDEKLFLKTIAKYLIHKKEKKQIQNVQKITTFISELEQEKPFPKELIKTLNIDLKPIHKELLEILNVDTLKVFIEKIEKLGQKYNIAGLVSYSEALLLSVNRFDLNKINELLNKFNEILKITD